MSKLTRAIDELSGKLRTAWQEAGDLRVRHRRRKAQAQSFIRTVKSFRAWYEDVPEDDKAKIVEAWEDWRNRDDS